MLRIGLVGCGRIGSLHAAKIAASPTARLVAVHDTDPERAARVAAVEEALTLASGAEVIAHPAVDAVFICSPTPTHVGLALEGIEAGKPVFCEKPIDLDVGRALEVLRALEAAPVTFMTGFHRRFDPAHQKLRQAIRHGQLGVVEFVRLISRDPAPPPIGYIETSGGIFRDMAIHDLDLCRWLLGEPITAVFAKTANLVDLAIGAAGDADTAAITLWTARGATCTILNSRRSNTGFDQRVEVFGSAASGEIGNVPLTTLTLRDRDGSRTDPLPDHFPERYAAAYALQLEAFVAAASTNQAAPTTAVDGIQSLVIADACSRSAATGRAVRIESGSKEVTHDWMSNASG